MSRLVVLSKRDMCQTFGRFRRCRPLARLELRQQGWAPSLARPKGPEADYLAAVWELMAESGRLLGKRCSMRAAGSGCGRARRSAMWGTAPFWGGREGGLPAPAAGSERQLDA